MKTIEVARTLQTITAEVRGHKREAVVCNEVPAIPIERALEAIDSMEYASCMRVIFRMLYLTGCRINEIDRFRMDLFIGNKVYWPLGKNQRGMRSVELPQEYLDELLAYRKRNYKFEGTRLFNITGDTFARYFNRDIRPRLSREWNLLIVGHEKSYLKCDEYYLQIKGLRKLRQTIIFHENYMKWKDAGVALEMTSKEMKHSSTRITAYHYIRDFDSVGLKIDELFCIENFERKRKEQSKLFQFDEFSKNYN